MCQICIDAFTVYNRRHHCRACGKVSFFKLFLVLKLPLYVELFTVLFCFCNILFRWQFSSMFSSSRKFFVFVSQMLNLKLQC